MIKEWLSMYQEDQPNKFNEEIIYGLREQDSMISYLEDVCLALESIPYIKYNGYDIITNENDLRQTSTISITDSRLDLITFKFTLSFKDQVKNITMPLFIPKWINKYYFILNGNKYFPIYQNVESSTYNAKDSVVLKSLLMPIIVKMKNTVIKDKNNKEYSGKLFMVNLFEHKTNFLLYYFSTFGFTETLKFFKYDKYIRFKKSKKNKKEKVLLFPINKNDNIIVNKSKFLNDNNFRNFVISLKDLLTSKTNLEKIDDTEYWLIKLGGVFTKNTNNQLNKAETVLLSFKRILDNRTKKNLLLDNEDKEDIYHLIRWMINNFDRLMKQDNLSLLNKRLRLSEYIITPFVRKMSNSTYRILNSKTLTFNKFESIMKPSPTIIISELQKSKLLRFNNATNDMDLFNCALKWSNRGPSALGEGSKKTVSIYYRGIHPSHLGRISLNSCSNSDPGMTGLLSPFIKTNGFYYSYTGDIDEGEENGLYDN